MSLYERARSRKHRIEEWIAFGTSLFTAYQTCAHLYGKYKERNQTHTDQKRYLVTVEQSDDDALYSYTVRWIMKQVTQKARQHIWVGQYGWEIQEVPSAETESYWIKWEDHDLFVKIEVPDMGGEDGKGSGLFVRGGKFTLGKTLTVSCPSLEVRQGFIEFMADLLPRHSPEEYTPWVYRASESGSWVAVKRIHKRSPDTLVLPEGQFEEMKADIEKFKGDEQRYRDLGIPWHRGYLLHGPPGTGKSSTITTLASEFKSDVYFLSVAELKDGSSLISALSECDSGDFLVLEDVDTASATSGRGDGKEESVFDTLLNTLDGVLTPDGLIVIMTTNHPEKLDSRLVRPGRVDRKFKLDFMNQQQLDKMLNVFLGAPYGSVSLVRKDLAPAEVVECLKSSIDFEPDYVLGCVRQVAVEKTPDN